MNKYFYEIVETTTYCGEIKLSSKEFEKINSLDEKLGAAIILDKTNRKGVKSTFIDTFAQFEKIHL